MIENVITKKPVGFPHPQTLAAPHMNGKIALHSPAGHDPGDHITALTYPPQRFSERIKLLQSLRTTGLGGTRMSIKNIYISEHTPNTVPSTVHDCRLLPCPLGSKESQDFFSCFPQRPELWQLSTPKLRAVLILVVNITSSSRLDLSL